MLLKNKITGEIKDVQLGNHNDPSDGIIVVYGENGQPRQPQAQYGSLAELIEEWEDAPKSRLKWHIGNSGIVHKEKTNLHSDAREAIGNSFDTESEARQAVKRLEALKRLRDKGFKFTYVGDYEMLCGNGFEIPIRGEMPPDYFNDKSVRVDLEFLFEEEQ